MIHIKNLTISFNQNNIFCQTEFIAKDDSLTIISGESGSGKSTLLNTLLFHHDCHYFYNDKDISKLDTEQKNLFIQQKMGIVYQLPAFLPSLTIKEHISMFIDLYQLHNLHKAWSDILDLHILLDKYPTQLSGGEKTRVALYLALLKEPEILILDEPTASLDKNYKMKVIQLLKEYCHEYHKTVIVSTHDHFMMDAADYLYCINDKKLELIKSIEENPLTNVYNKQKVHYEALNKYIKQIRKHYKLYYKILILILGCTFGFLMISLSLNNSSISQAKEMLNDMASREVFVYKPLSQNASYSYNTSEYPISEDELKKIKNIEGIERVEWRFNTPIDIISTLVSSEENYKKQMNDQELENEKIQTITSFDDEKVLNEKVIDCLKQNTYIDNYDYNKSVSKTFNDTGIYISSDLFKELFNQDVQHPFIKFYLMVPLYDTTGVREIFINDDQTVPSNMTSCDYLEIIMPIKGVLDTNVLTHEDYFNYQIYISQSDLLSYITQQTIKDTRSVYFSDKTQKMYFGILPDNITPTQTNIQTKWRPNSYSVTVKDLEDLPHVVTQLKANGFAVASNYFNTASILEAKESVKHMMSIVSSVLLVIVSLLYCFVKFINRKKDKESDRFLEMLGCTKKQKQSFYRSEYLYNWRDQFLIAVVFFFICRFVIMKLNIAVIRPDPMIFIEIAVFTFFIEYIVPALLKRENKYDYFKKTKN